MKNVLGKPPSVSEDARKRLNEDCQPESSPSLASLLREDLSQEQLHGKVGREEPKALSHASGKRRLYLIQRKGTFAH